MRNDLCIVLTARMGSERLPGKAMLDVNDQPLIYWIIRRLQSVGNVVLGITTNKEDDPLEAFAKAINLPVVRWQQGDVVGTIEAGYKQFYPNSKFVMRGLADMPWLAGELVERACNIMAKCDGDAFAWATANVYPCYGAREFPYSRKGWQLINANSKTREHADAWFHENRQRFNTVYHSAPHNDYWRAYRLEVDYPEDLELVRQVAKHVSMLAPFTQIIKFLDSHTDIAQLNHSRVERTGPSLFAYELQRKLINEMKDKPIYDWSDRLWPMSPDKHGTPIHCKSGRCLLGMANNGILFSKAGRFKSGAYLTCECGAGLLWQ